MKKLLSLSLLLTVAIVMGQVQLTAHAQTAEESEWVCPEGFEGQTLRIFNWSTYIAEDTVPHFEELCGVTVEYFEYGSNEEMINVVRANSAQYDLVFPSDNAVGRLVAEELLQPLDHSLIPNLANISDPFQATTYDPGNIYSIPYQWGTVGIGVDTSVIEDPSQFKTWGDFFAYEGRVAWVENPRIMLGLVLKLQGVDPNTLDQAEIDAAADFLINYTQNDLYQIAQDNGQDLLVQGEVDAVIEYSGDIFQIMADCECDDFAYVVPEGTDIWVDNMSIPYNAPNVALAHAFIDYILDPVIGASVSNYIQYATPNAAALPLVDPAMRDNPAIYPDEAIIASGFSLIDTGDAEVFYSDAWNRMSAALAE